jgi:hypothetical protein
VTAWGERLTVATALTSSAGGASLSDPKTRTDWQADKGAVFAQDRTGGPPPTPRQADTESCSRPGYACPNRAIVGMPSSVPSVPTGPAERRRETARKAALARWTSATSEQRSEAARVASAARWAGHVATSRQTARQPRACRYCGDVVPMTVRQIKCAKASCNLDHRAARLGIGPAAFVSAR